jgi:hypothetical protein
MDTRFVEVPDWTEAALTPPLNVPPPTKRLWDVLERADWIDDDTEPELVPFSVATELVFAATAELIGASCEERVLPPMVVEVGRVQVEPVTVKLGVVTASPTRWAATPFTVKEPNAPVAPFTDPELAVTLPSTATSPNASMVNPLPLAVEVPVFKVRVVRPKISRGALASIAASPDGGLRFNGPVIEPPAVVK